MLVNVTVDDQFGDPYTYSQITYTPTEAWSTALNCSHCPDPSVSSAKVRNQTWHESYFSSDSNSGAVRPDTPRYASIQFTGEWLALTAADGIRSNEDLALGNAVYVTCIIPPSINDVTNRMKFFVDGILVGSYPLMSTSSELAEWQYGVVVYQNTSMSLENHQLLIQSGEEGGPDAIILLDSIMYSTFRGLTNGSISANNSTPGPRRVPSAPIVGASVGGFVLILVCGLLFFVHRRRRRSFAVTIQSFHLFVEEAADSSYRQSLRTQTRMSIDSPESIRTAASHLNIDSLSTRSAKIDCRTQSILAWQQNTQQGNKSPDLAALDMSEELSSYYDNATTTESRRVRTPPPPSRRYIVTNK
ncbi:hypothetical protein DFJ43DRAFT_1158590 [Lentinula guzmanii]|uniref:Uncharacterized protein n=1 Tax=Lentinula guzmanii TaxID=2804957 RepID=A0AA38MWG0_9AGAR|nr:hypothetical protein DFJ43DRAFT_1158590 [Lentinula guzmanii]